MVWNWLDLYKMASYRACATSILCLYRTIDVSKEIDNARYTEVSEELRKVCNLSSRQVFKSCNTLEEIERRLDFTEPE